MAQSHTSTGTVLSGLSSSQMFMVLIFVLSIHIGAIGFGILEYVDEPQAAAQWLGIPGLLGESLPYAHNYFVAMLWSMRTLSGMHHRGLCTRL